MISSDYYLFKHFHLQCFFHHRKPSGRQEAVQLKVNRLFHIQNFCFNNSTTCQAIIPKNTQMPAKTLSLIDTLFLHNFSKIPIALSIIRLFGIICILISYASCLCRKRWKTYYHVLVWMKPGNIAINQRRFDLNSFLCLQPISQ